MSWLQSLVIFAVFYRAGEQHFTMPQCAWLAGMQALAYLLTSLAAGRLISRRNARLILISGAFFSIAAIMLCLYAGRFAAMLAGMALTGIFAAFFFNALQAFLRGESPPGSLMKTVGLYTVSWSLGCAFGFISAGSFYRLGFRILALLTLAIGGAIILIVIRHRRRPLAIMSSEEHIEEGPPDARPVNGHYIWIGWLLISSAIFIQKSMISFFPALSAADGLSPLTASLPLFLNYAVQAFAGLAMVRWRRLLYRRRPLVVMHVSAAILLLIVWQQPTLAVCSAAFALLGVYFGFVYFSSVYYSSNSGNRVFNISINECLVGLAALAGLFSCAGWMRFTANPAGLYAVCGAALIVSALAQLLPTFFLRSWR